jgi:hypothetical protein
MPRKIAGFSVNQSGAAMPETLLVLGVLLILLMVFIEFGFAVSQWNRAAKAVQVGARLAAVSDPLSSTLVDFTGLPSTGPGPPNPGDPINPSDAYDIICPDADATVCPDFDQLALDWIVGGSDPDTSDGVLDCTGTAPVLGMCDVFPAIGVDNVRIRYQFSGLGYAGRPGGPVPTVTVSLVNVNFPCLILCGLFGLNSISIPVAPVTYVGEDLSTLAP